MSVDSGLTGPIEASSASAVPRASASTDRPARTRRRGPAAADAVADAVSTPSFRSSSSRRPRRRGRRVTRIVRRVELWSVLKIGLVFNTVMLGVGLGAVAILWGLANTTGLLDDLEGFLQDAGFEGFTFEGDAMFQRVAFIGAVGALATTVFMVLSAALLNLISEITGGIRFVVIEEIIDEPHTRPGPPGPLALPVVPSLAAGPPPPAPPRPPAPAAPGPRSGLPMRPAPTVGLTKDPGDDRATRTPRPTGPPPAARPGPPRGPGSPSSASGGTPRRGSDAPTGPRKKISPAKGARPRTGPPDRRRSSGPRDDA